VDVELAPGNDLDRERLPPEPFLQALAAPRELRRHHSGMIGAQMRRRRDHSDARRSRGPRQLDRVVFRPGAVVHAGKDV
jgi:hypothetical protein